MSKSGPSNTISLSINWDDGKNDEVELNPQDDQSLEMYLNETVNQRFRILKEAEVDGKPLSESNGFHFESDQETAEIDLKTEPITTVSATVFHDIGSQSLEARETLKSKANQWSDLDKSKRSDILKKTKDLLNNFLDALDQAESFLPIKLNDNDLIDDLSREASQLSSEPASIVNEKKLNELSDLLKRVSDESKQLLGQLDNLDQELNAIFQKVRSHLQKFPDGLNRLSDKFKNGEEGAGYDELTDMAAPLSDLIEKLDRLDECGMIRLSLSLSELERYQAIRQKIERIIQSLQDSIEHKETEQISQLVDDELIPLIRELDTLTDELKE